MNLFTEIKEQMSLLKKLSSWLSSTPSEKSLDSTEKKPLNLCSPDHLCSGFKLTEYPLDNRGTLESTLGISRERREELQDHYINLIKSGNIINFFKSVCEFCKNPNEIFYITIQLGANLHGLPKEFLRHSGAPSEDSDLNKGTKVSNKELDGLLKELGINSDDIPGLNDTDDDQDYGMKRRGDKPSFSNDVDD